MIISIDSSSVLFFQHEPHASQIVSSRCMSQPMAIPLVGAPCSDNKVVYIHKAGRTRMNSLAVRVKVGEKWFEGNRELPCCRSFHCYRHIVILFLFHEETTVFQQSAIHAHQAAVSSLSGIMRRMHIRR